MQLVRARWHAMSDDALQLPPLGDHRPTRGDDAPVEGARPTTALLLQPDHQPDQADRAPPDDAGASGAIDPVLPSTDPDAAPAPTAHHLIGRTTSALAACGAHVLVLFALISAPSTEFGGGGVTLDAISVSIIPASAIDARQPTSDTSASAAPARIAPDPGSDSTASEATPEKIAAPPEPRTELPAKESDEISDRLAAPAEAAPEAVPDEARKVTSAPTPPEEVLVATVEPPPTPQPAEKEMEEAPREDASAQPSPSADAAGGATSHGTAAGQPPRPATAAASRGEINAYGMAVQSALLAVDQREAEVRASASRSKGTVVVRISIDEKGALISTEVVTTSGSPQLDAAALLLIRLASFPIPPPGLTAAERSYLAPIRFR